MKKVLFYCQHILGMGHLVRSLAIVRGLAECSEVCFINGGEAIPELSAPPGVEVVNLPAIKTDANFRELVAVDDQGEDLEALQARRCDHLLALCERFRPDVLVIELFPFGRRRFSFELVPLIEKARSQGAQVVCSLRDIVVTKQDQARHETKVCQLMNRYFDLLLVHGDPRFVSLEETFSRVADLTCPVHYTGYVVQEEPQAATALPADRPTVLVSIGGGRFGHELIDASIQAAALLQDELPHRFQIFTGPFMPAEKLEAYQALTQDCPNVVVERFTPHLTAWMRRADLSISMSGYNTTMNVLTTGVRALLLAFTGNDDLEQTLRSQRLEDLGVVGRIRPEELHPDRFAAKIRAALAKSPESFVFDLDGVRQTTLLIEDLLSRPQAALQPSGWTGRTATTVSTRKEIHHG